jgi:PTH1 family peptidyl-tRNA hydrolase
MKMVVGLGNPGPKYDGTRHNVGYDAIRELAKRHQAGLPKGKFQGEICEVTIEGEKTLLVCPLTFMNLSGVCVQPAVSFYKIEQNDLLVICDDFAIALGKLRVRAKGSAGGQKGLSDIIRRLGTEEVPRLRIGIGPVPAQWDPADFVLGKFSQDEKPIVADAIKRTADAVSVWVKHGIEKCMNQFNA